MYGVVGVADEFDSSASVSRDSSPGLTRFTVLSDKQYFRQYCGVPPRAAPRVPPGESGSQQPRRSAASGAGLAPWVTYPPHTVCCRPRRQIVQHNPESTPVSTGRLSHTLHHTPTAS